MKILKKISLIIVGIILSLVILEIGLQTVYYSNKLIKNYKINKQLKDKDTITILCLGESTTDGQWPPILQKILDEKSKNKKFNIIDAGKIGCNTNDIIIKASNIILNENIDIIISMMGINDINNNVIKIRRYKLKIFKLFYLLKKHLIANLFADTVDTNNILLEKATILLNSKNYNDAIKILKNLKDIELNNKQIIDKYKLLIRILLATNNHIIDKNNYVKIKEYSNIINSIKNNAIFDITLRLMIYEKDIDELENLFSDANLNKYLNSYFDPIMCSIKDLEKIGLKNIVERINMSIYNSINEKNSYSKTKNIGYIALNFFLDKDYKKAKDLFDLQTNILLNKNSKMKTLNYIRLANICKKNNIKLIVMQYPVRSIKPLKKILNNFNDITFVSNEENFKQALKKYKLEKIFTDRFAGDFGHCTYLGNTLIAENVAETILNLYN